jgi:SAM-dependent methyltransferase
MNARTNPSYREIAPHYNALNRIPRQASGHLGDALMAVAADRPVLDIGAGAGRFALPAARAGARIVALDIERAMLIAADCEAREVRVALTQTQADARALPYADKTFGVVMLNNMVHSVNGWEQALIESRRVMTIGGVIVMLRDVLDPDSVFAAIRMRWRQTIGMLQSSLRPASSAGPALFTQLAALGGCVEPELTVASWHERLSPRRLLDRIRVGAFCESWQVDSALRATALAQLEPWVAGVFDMDAIHDARWHIGMTVIRGLA